MNLSFMMGVVGGWVFDSYFGGVIERSKILESGLVRNPNKESVTEIKAKNNLSWRMGVSRHDILIPERSPINVTSFKTNPLFKYDSEWRQPVPRPADWMGGHEDSHQID